MGQLQVFESEIWVKAAFQTNIQTWTSEVPTAALSRNTLQISQGLVYRWRKSGMGDWQSNLCSVCTDVDAVLVCCDKERVDSESKLSIYFPTLTFGYELWVVTTRNLNEWIHTVENRLYHGWAWLVGLIGELHHSGVKLLLLCIKKSQLKWFMHLIIMPPGCPLGSSKHCLLLITQI